MLDLLMLSPSFGLFGTPTTPHLPGVGISNEIQTASSPKRKLTLYRITQSENRQDKGTPNLSQGAAGPDHALFQPQKDNQVTNCGSKMKEFGSEEADCTYPKSDMDGEVKSIEKSNSQSWTRRESHSAPCTSMSLKQMVDFSELEQEEKIAQMKARLKQKQAAVNNLQSS